MSGFEIVVVEIRKSDVVHYGTRPRGNPSALNRECVLAIENQLIVEAQINDILTSCQ